MATTKHRRANRHEVCDRVVSIANELCAFSMRPRMRVESDVVLLGDCSQSMPGSISSVYATRPTTHSGLGVVQLHSPGKSALRKKAKLRDDELVKLLRHN
jgi:hypothetical protein